MKECISVFVIMLMIAARYHAVHIFTICAASVKNTIGCYDLSFGDGAVNPKHFSRLGRDIVPAMHVRAAVKKRVSGVQNIRRIVVEVYLNNSREHVDQLLAIMSMRCEVAAAWLDYAEHWEHHVLAHRDQREHLQSWVTLQLNRFTAALADETHFLCSRFHKVQWALVVKMRQFVEHIQRNVAAVFQLAQVCD